jgi:hypothetical protein
VASGGARTARAYESGADGAPKHGLATAGGHHVALDPSLRQPIVPVPLVGLSGAYLLALAFSWLLVYAFTAPSAGEESAQSG